jgi:hypothetical protein
LRGAFKGHLFGDLVTRGFATGLTVVETLFAEADVELSLAEHAVFLALATFFDLFALIAAGFAFGSHGETVALDPVPGNVPLVTKNRL